MTIKDAIPYALKQAGKALPIHEIAQYFPEGVHANDAAISARLRELRRDGKVVGEWTEPKTFKYWRLP